MLLKQLGSPKCLQVESVFGKGTHFWFEIPIVMPDSINLPEPESLQFLNAPTTPNNNMLILPTIIDFSPSGRIAIVDDNEFNLLSMKKQFLNIAHVEVNTFSGGQKLLQAMENGSFFKVILLDSNMPIMNGLETLSRLQLMHNDGMIKEMPCVVICSASVDQEERANYLKLGANDYVLKPLGDNILSLIHI
eukprot:TRINITY_DN14040_c0_g1_i1.p1 TRINITY_DN14040_c0_g1~~TRINITY_DN14040_c0_g1_i1.p1  ORF type:complete len:191 (-),score=12.03 TRINITY_DN14040_c0_g1_i1:60-632(-)